MFDSKPDIGEILNLLISAWAIWISTAAAVVTFTARRNKKSMDAAFSKIRDLNGGGHNK